MTRTRDNQRAKLYAAERFAWTNAATDEELSGRADVKWYTDGSLPTAADAQAYIDAALANPAVRERFGRSACRKVEVYYGGRGATGGARIRLGTETRSKWVALHELAHTITGRYFEDPRYRVIEVHGAQFAAVYLFLVRAVMGDEAANNLRAAFELYGVKFVKSWEPY